MWTGETWRKILRFAEAKRIRGKKTDLCANPMCTLRFSRLFFFNVFFTSSNHKDHILIIPESCFGSIFPY